MNDANVIDRGVTVGTLVEIWEDVTAGATPADEGLLLNEGSAVGVEVGTEVDVCTEEIEVDVWAEAFELGAESGVEMGVVEDAVVDGRTGVEYAVVDGSTGIDVLDVEETTTGGVLTTTGFVDEGGTGVSLGEG